MATVFLTVATGSAIQFTTVFFQYMFFSLYFLIAKTFATHKRNSISGSERHEVCIKSSNIFEMSAHGHFSAVYPNHTDPGLEPHCLIGPKSALG